MFIRNQPCLAGGASKLYCYITQYTVQPLSNALIKAFDLRFHSFDQWFYDKYFIVLLSILSCLYTNWESILWCMPQSKWAIINSCMKLYGLPLRDAIINQIINVTSHLRNLNKKH